MNEKQIILASSSPRRIEMMKENGINPIIIPPDVSENLPETIGPKDAVLFLALKKALAVEESAIQMGLTNGEIIIAADTVVFLDSIIGKPQNEKEAFKILKDLCGKMHFVMTGVAILKSGKSDREVFYETTKVFFKSYTDDQIIEYIHTNEPYDKAGGYAIQGAWGKYVDHIEGDYHNVIGFPWKRILNHLQKF